MSKDIDNYFAALNELIHNRYFDNAISENNEHSDFAKVEIHSSGKKILVNFEKANILSEVLDNESFRMSMTDNIWITHRNDEIYFLHFELKSKRINFKKCISKFIQSYNLCRSIHHYITHDYSNMTDKVILNKKLVAKHRFILFSTTPNAPKKQTGSNGEIKYKSQPIKLYEYLPEIEELSFALLNPHRKYNIEQFIS